MTGRREVLSALAELAAVLEQLEEQRQGELHAHDGKGKEAEVKGKSKGPAGQRQGDQHAHKGKGNEAKDEGKSKGPGGQGHRSLKLN